MIKRCRVKAVSKFNGLLVDDDKKWFNATKEALPNLPDLKQFINETVDLYLVDGKDHSYSGIALINEGTEVKQQVGNSGGDSVVSSSNLPPKVNDRTTVIERFAALKCASGMLERGSLRASYFDLAEDIIKWVKR